MWWTRTGFGRGASSTCGHIYVVSALHMFQRRLSLPSESAFLLGPRGTGKSTWLCKSRPSSWACRCSGASASRDGARRGGRQGAGGGRARASYAVGARPEAGACPPGLAAEDPRRVRARHGRHRRHRGARAGPQVTEGRILVALLSGRAIGRVEQNLQGKLTFTYEAEWQSQPFAVPLSLSLPLDTRAHAHGPVEAFLWGLLPDNAVEEVEARDEGRRQVPHHRDRRARVAKAGVEPATGKGAPPRPSGRHGEAHPGSNRNHPRPSSPRGPPRPDRRSPCVGSDGSRSTIRDVGGRSVAEGVAAERSD